MDPIERLRFLASLPRAGAGREKTQPFNWIHSRLFTPNLTAIFICLIERESANCPNNQEESAMLAMATELRGNRKESVVGRNERALAQRGLGNRPTHVETVVTDLLLAGH